jgi:hypothetical protein
MAGSFFLLAFALIIRKRRRKQAGKIAKSVNEKKRDSKYILLKENTATEKVQEKMNS